MCKTFFILFNLTGNVEHGVKINIDPPGYLMPKLENELAHSLIRRDVACQYVGPKTKLRKEIILTSINVCAFATLFVACLRNMFGLM